MPARHFQRAFPPSRVVTRDFPRESLNRDSPTRGFFDSPLSAHFDSNALDFPLESPVGSYDWPISSTINAFNSMLTSRIPSLQRDAFKRYF
jgi:hypothetical protein